MRSPEATSSASVSATSTTTSTAPARPPSVAPRAPCRSVSTRFARSAPAAGARPDSAPLPSDTASAKASTRQSSGTGPPPAMAGSHAAASVSRPRDRATPAAPPAAASNALSAASWPSTCRRLAPSAARIAISRDRPVARTSRRLVTFAQAIRSTPPTAIASSASVPRTLRVELSRNGTSLIADPRDASVLPGWPAAYARAIPPSSASPSADVAPGARRASAVR